MKYKQARSFSLFARGRSFGYAWQGINAFFRSEHNAVLHGLGTLLVVLMAILFPPTAGEGAALVLATGFVWAAELFNTAIEKVMDYLCAEKRPAIKYIKDLSAGAVLIAALTALLVALFVFIPKL
jgi:diacylglycerol kinase (ATP)